MMKDKLNDHWVLLDQLEDKANGMFVGGLIFGEKTKGQEAMTNDLPSGEITNVHSILQAHGIIKIVPKKSGTIADMKREILYILEANAKFASLAARSFADFPDEAVKSIYEELMELQDKAKQGG